MDARRFAPATDRNREPIAEVLGRVLPETGTVLEIASGTGQHAAFFAARFPGLRWQPSDADPGALASIDAWRAHAGLDNLAPALRLDVTERPWPVTEVDVVWNANMIHIAPWAACQALFEGAARHLVAGGSLVTYGPYAIDGAHTAPSNEAFDARLRSEDPAWGVRDLADVLATAEGAGFTLRERVPMPANNFTLIFARAV